MNREIHVRFWEGVGVKVSCATQLSHRSDHSSSIFSLEGGLDGLPLRVSNEGLPRPRVARAQEII